MLELQSAAVTECQNKQHYQYTADSNEQPVFCLMMLVIVHILRTQQCPACTLIGHHHVCCLQARQDTRGDRTNMGQLSDKQQQGLGLYIVKNCNCGGVFGLS